MRTLSNLARGQALLVRRALLATALALSVLTGTWHGAAAMMLYENRLPDGYAYVRFVNTLTEPLALKPVGFADPVALGTDGAARISAYHVVEDVAGRTLSVEVGPAGERVSFELKPSGVHTVLLERTVGTVSAKVVTDQAELSQTKARLAFYNAVADCAAANLQLEPGGQSVFSGVGPNLMRGRAVNPAPNPRMRASCGAARTASVDLGPLDAGGQYSVWLMAPAGAPTAFLSKNTIAPYLR